MLEPRVEYVLRLADGALLLGQRLSELCGHGPVLEEDIATTNIALDCIGQARLLLTLAGKLEGQGRDEDRLAFLRNEGEYRNPTLLELPNGDFGRVVLRTFLYSSFLDVLWPALQSSTDADLAAIAAKSAKETRYHREHTADWVIRLGDGTDESHRRMREALDALWPYTAELFSPDPVDDAVARDGFGVAWATLRDPWLRSVEAVLAEATLAPPPDTPFLSRGKTGVHTEHLGHLLAPMQHLQRVHPGAKW